MTYNRNVEIDDDDEDCVIIGDRKYRTHRGSGIVQDGFVVRKRMTMMDGALPDAITDPALADHRAANRGLHAPGQCLALTDAQRDAREHLLDARDKRLTDAWRTPPPTADAAPAKPDAPINDSEARYLARDRKLENAWRGGAA